jgi:predicted enzyme related to lactoylglutathione lyase
LEATMSERSGYQHGVPCWVDTWQADPETAVPFYESVFGWEAQVPPAGEEPHYVMFQLDGADVAGLGSPPPDGTGPAWTTYVWVDDVDEAVARATAAGGSAVREPFDSLDGGRMAIVADPAGATVALWQPGAHRGAERVNEPSAYAMSMLVTPDPERAAAFYGAVFGWTTEAFGPATMFRLPGYVGGEPSQPVSREVVATMMPSDGDARWTVDFWIADADAAARAATERGGRVLDGPSDAPPFRSAVLADPAGADFSVSQLVTPPS